MASAAADILSVAMELRDRELIDDAEFLRLVYDSPVNRSMCLRLLPAAGKTKQQMGCCPGRDGFLNPPGGSLHPSISERSFYIARLQHRINHWSRQSQ
jgi:hypothetical protein